MKKKELKKEENAYKKLHEIMNKLDSYEEIYPDREIEEIQQMDVKTIDQLKEYADVFFHTDIYSYILNILKLEMDMKEFGVLSEADIMEALHVRDRLYLMSSAGVKNEEELDADVQIQFYKERRESLLSALTKNKRTICVSDTYKGQKQTERHRQKIMNYLRVIENNIKRLEAEQIG